MAVFGKINWHLLWLVMMIATWCVAIAAGTGFMVRYGASAGAARVTPARWPAETAIQRNVASASLFVFLHPHCPCSRATIEQLNTILTRSTRDLSVKLIFVKPPQAEEEWMNTSLAGTATNLANVSVHIDENGSEARRFGAETSGHTVLYSASGELLFAGGITPSRGQIGENLGAEQIIALVNGTNTLSQGTPVFGCPLFTPEFTPENCCNTGDRECRN